MFVLNSQMLGLSLEELMELVCIVDWALSIKNHDLPTIIVI